MGWHRVTSKQELRERGVVVFKRGRHQLAVLERGAPIELVGDHFELILEQETMEMLVGLLRRSRAALPEG